MQLIETQLKGYGHVIGMAEVRLPKIELEAEPYSRTRRRRPKTLVERNCIEISKQEGEGEIKTKLRIMVLNRKNTYRK